MNKGLLKKGLVLAVLAALAASFYAFGLDRYLTLSHLKESLAGVQGFYAGSPFYAISAYMAVYIAVSSLSLPGAAVMGVAGGSLFGLWTGTLVVSFSSSIGATLACLVSRFLLRGFVERRFGGIVERINGGLRREGAFYLFAMRLIPVIPYFAINLVMGLTKMRLFTFYWVSQVGMLAGTMVYVNAGKEIAKIESVSGIFSPRLIVSFALIGIFPIAAKKIVGLYRAKKGMGAEEIG